MPRPEKIVSNGCICCDNCQSTPPDGEHVMQVNVETCIYIYCMNCWFRHGKKMKANGML